MDDGRSSFFSVNATSRELEPELEALKALERGLESKSLPEAELGRISAESFEAVLLELAARNELELLAGVGGLRLDRARQKLWKKTLHRLKSRGLQIPEKAAGAKVTFPARIIREWARATPVISITGEQLLYYFASGTMGTNLLISQLSPVEGIQDLRVFAVAESQAQKIVANLSIGKELKLPVLEIGKDHFLRAMVAAREKTSERKFKMELDSFLEKFRLKLPEPADAAAEPSKLFDPEKIPAVVARPVEALLAHTFFSTWVFDQETVNGCARELDEAQHSPIQLSDAQLADRVQSIFEKYSARGLEKNRERIKYGLLENARLLKLQGETDAAAAAFKLASGREDQSAAAEFSKAILVRSFPEAAKQLGHKPGGLIIPGR